MRQTFHRIGCDSEPQPIQILEFGEQCKSFQLVKILCTRHTAYLTATIRCNFFCHKKSHIIKRELLTWRTHTSFFQTYRWRKFSYLSISFTLSELKIDTLTCVLVNSSFFSMHFANAYNLCIYKNMRILKIVWTFLFESVYIWMETVRCVVKM